MNNHCILITGASGFLGGSILRRCRQEGRRFRCTSRRSLADNENGCFVPADLCNQQAITPLMNDIECVIHTAGLAHQFGSNRASLTRFHEQNTVATQNTIEAAGHAGVRRFVLISSVSVYGGGDKRPVTEEDETAPRDPYATSKLNAEHAASEVAAKFDMQLTILRLATLYGAGDPGNMARLIRAIQRRRFVCIGQGQNMKSLLHVKDAAKACLLAASDNGADGQPGIYNVTAAPVTMRQILHEIYASLQRPIRRRCIPSKAVLAASAIGKGLPLVRSRAQHAEALVRKWLANDCYAGERFADAYGFKPDVPLAMGVADEVSWVLRQ